MKKKHHACIVKWRDSSSLRGWQSMTADHGVAIIHSVGWIAREAKDEITLTVGISENGSVCDAITIPREAIVKIQRLKYHVEGH